MPFVIKQPHTEVHTKDGELKITLDITLNINTLGQIADTPVDSNDKSEDMKWEIPSFKNKNKIKFGKKVED